MKAFLKIVTISILIYFSSWFFVYKTGINDLSIQSEDTLPAMFIPVAIIKEGTIYLDSYYDMLLEKYPHPDDKDYELGLVPFYLREVVSKGFNCAPFGECVPFEHTHYVSAFPIITALLALPIYFFPVILGIPINFETVTILAHISAGFIVALSGGFLYLLLRDHFFEKDSEAPLRKQKSFLLTLIYLFATVNYAQVSQALWQHGTVQLFTILALLAIYKRKYILTGLFFGLMFLSRPTSGILVVFLGLLTLARFFDLPTFSLKEFFQNIWIQRKDVAQIIKKLILGLIPPILFFLWYNKVFYGDISNQGYSNQIFTEWKGRFPEGFLGLWLSPSKGILIYSPVFIFSLLGLGLVIKRWRQNLDYILFGLIILLHTLVLGKWKHWYGGWSFGYRMASDIIPFLILFIVPFIKSGLFKKLKMPFYLLFGISFLVQIFGMVFFDGVWHAAYDLGFDRTSWLWSIRNSEFGFNIRRVFVKIGLLNSPF